LGWTDGPALFYATGGLAYGRVTTDLDFFALPGLNTAVGRFSEDRWGWTVGAGIEAQLVGNWTGKLEYLYVDLGTVSGATIAVGPGGFAGRAFAFSSGVHDHIVRLGVNYKLGDPVYVAPAPARGVYKAPVAAVAYTWSGLYIGGNVGLSVARNPTTAPITDPLGAGPLQNSQVYLSPSGFVGGGQIGFNWQAAPNVVWGVEADFQGSGQKDTKTCLDACEPPAGGSLLEPITQKIPWFGTLRARLGLSNGPTLFYATGGWASGKVTTDIVLAEPPAGTVAGSFSQTKSGWVVGGGIESRLWGNWTGKLEYLYMDLGTVSGSTPSAGGNIAGFSSDVRDHIVRVGLNYKLDWAGPVVAKY
jgi:outer membrane immunogenic protein